jgi:hypothetical protein
MVSLPLIITGLVIVAFMVNPLAGWINLFLAVVTGITIIIFALIRLDQALKEADHE